MSSPKSTDKPEPLPKPPAKPQPDASTNSEGEMFGLEGTNKTVPEPQPNAEPVESEHRVPGKHVGKTPYTRKV
jgi:hypothetical protein